MSTPQTLTGSDVPSDPAKNKGNKTACIGGLSGFLALCSVLLNSTFVEWGNMTLIPAALFFLAGTVLAAYAAWSTVDIYSLPLDTECPDTVPPPMRGPDTTPLRPRVADPLTAIPLGPPQQYQQPYSTNFPSTFPYAPSASVAPAAPSAPPLGKIETPPDEDNPPSYDEVVRPEPYHTPDRSFRRVFDQNTKYGLD